MLRQISRQCQFDCETGRDFERSPRPIIANPALNVTRLSGLVKNVSLPIVSTAQTSGFVAQDAAYQTGDMVFALPCVMVPHLLTTQLKVISGIDLPRVLRNRRTTEQLTHATPGPWSSPSRNPPPA